MKKYLIFPDVNCDLSAEMREYFGLQDYIKGFVHIDDKELRASLDWEEISRADFYKMLMDKRMSVTTATPSPEEYYQTFKKYYEEGYAIISMSLSSKISSTYSLAVAAAERVKAENPDFEIYCFDTLRMSGSFGLLVAYALDLQKQGKTYEEVIAWLEENKGRVHQMGPIDGLSFIARRGRISKGKAIMGDIVGVKPMGDSNVEGYVTVLAKAKGIKKALRATVKYVQAVAKDIENQYVFIYHSDREELAYSLKEQFESAIKCKKLFVSDVFCSCGTNIGPGMIGVYFLGDPVSEDSGYEKEALLKALAES